MGEIRAGGRKFHVQFAPGGVGLDRWGLPGYNAAMVERRWGELDAENAGKRLFWLYFKVFLGYLMVMWLFWWVGIEGIYQNPLPFYALYSPAFMPPWLSVSAMGIVAFILLNGLVAAVFCLGVWRLRRVLARGSWFDEEVSPETARRVVVGCVVFAFVFAGAVAMLRGGPAGIVHTYERQAYEYIGDIGLGGSIRGLFRDYSRIHPYLSMHSKVHPPGPIAILWVLSYGVGRSPLALSLATMAFGCLAIVPLYLLAQDMTSRRCALTCCLLYTLVPSVVLFTATSADITFMPFTILTLLLFWRAIHRCSWKYAVAAGLMYAVLSLISFSLVALGAFFGFVGLWRLFDGPGRKAVVVTAFVMVCSAAALHIGVYLWSGFDVVACFQASKAQFDVDQVHLDLVTPRYPGWTWRIFNPACWFFYAGIPVSILFVWRLVRPAAGTRALFLTFALTLVVLDMLYLARGESERSAMYVLPFVLIPAAHLLDEIGGQVRSHAVLLATLGFLAFQCWFTESHFYTYW